MATKKTGNFIMISPHESMQNSGSPIAIFRIKKVDEEDTTACYPIMSNFYDTVVYSGNGTTLKDLNSDSVPPQALQYKLVNKIVHNHTAYWLSNVGIDSLKYRAIENSAKYITISTTDDWNTYTVAFVSDDVG